jgi:F-type H+-transporting ATPase subunit alpha
LTLLSLAEGFFDPIPIDQMNLAQQELQNSAKNIPGDICKRFTTSKKLSDEDRKILLEMAQKSLSHFQIQPDTKTQIHERK